MAEYTGKAGRKGLTDTQKRDKQYPEKPTKNSMKVDSFLPSPPDGMGADARDEWNRVGEYLLLTERVSKLDTQSLAFYCNSYAVFADGCRQLLIRRERIWGEVRGRPKPSKLVDIISRHGAIVVRQSRKFGMTARTRHLDHQYGCGRPATPAQIHALRGTVSKSRGKQAIAPPQEWKPESVARPNWLSNECSAEWQRLVDQLTVVDLWTPLDVGPIAVLCGAYSLAKRCANELSDQSLILPIRDAEGVVEHPLSVIYRELFVLCETIWQDYGMSPFDRQQFHHIEGEQQGRPKFAVFPGEMA